MLPLIYRREKGKGVESFNFLLPRAGGKKYQFGILRGGGEGRGIENAAQSKIGTFSALLGPRYLIQEDGMPAAYPRLLTK